VERDEINADLAAALVAEQFPQWADLPVVPVSLNGWDNTTFRLGDQLSIRLPNGEGYAAAVEKEHRWLPVLAPQLPVPIPQPVAIGRPGHGYPWSWSIYRWLPGTPASEAPIADVGRFATQLAGFLNGLSAADASDGPAAGPGSAHRGGPLSHYDDGDIPEAIHLLADRYDTNAVERVWQSALSSQWERPPVWVHGDLTGSNLLVTDGALSAVIDFGCAAIGDPACDLTMAWTFFTRDSTEQFQRGLGYDRDTWARARGWALWKSLVTILRAKGNNRDEYADARRFGWRHDPYEVIDRVLADHSSSRRGPIGS
jgi:aminoglycoside phosphotransferase (APT) family kinase protein